MCVAILKLPAGSVTEDRLRACFNNNRDGGGFAFVKDGKVVINKGFMEFKDFMDAYALALAENKDSKFLIHFRIATAGAVSPANTHPFPVSGGALIHNGHMFYTLRSAEKSDTRLTAEKLSTLLPDRATWFLAKDVLAKELGSYNKVAVLFDDGEHLILNEDNGKWENNVWYSNTHSFSSWATSRQPLAPVIPRAPAAVPYNSRGYDPLNAYPEGWPVGYD